MGQKVAAENEESRELIAPGNEIYATAQSVLGWQR